jgi:hypothetical protein
VWLILDQQNPKVADAAMMTRPLDAWGSPATDTWFGHYHLLGYLAHEPPLDTPSVAQHEVFGSSLTLSGYDLSTRLVMPGQGLTLSLYFLSETPLKSGEKAFVHLEDQRGQIVGQRDRPLSGAGRDGNQQPSSNEPIREGFDLVVPPATATGEYTLSFGIYDPVTGKRLPITAGSSAGRDNVVLGPVTVRAE